VTELQAAQDPQGLKAGAYNSIHMTLSSRQPSSIKRTKILGSSLPSARFPDNLESSICRLQVVAVHPSAVTDLVIGCDAGYQE
jgi:hypothetical protein